jgi:Zn-dependent protease with chaperone function
MDEANYAKCSCPACLNHVAFPTNLLGTLIDCPHCARPFRLELEAGTTLSQPAAGLDLPTIEAAFQGKVEIRETTAQYKVAVALVAAVMLLMVLIYLAIVAGAAGGLIWHATQHVSLVSGARSGGFVRWLIYLTPIIILLLLLLFLVKPLLARRAPRNRSQPLDPRIEPLLYSFVAKLCDATGAPMPACVCLDCSVNAGAGFAPAASGAREPELSLTLGLVLVAGLTLQQFAGVVAHELGHFNQKRTLRFLRWVWGIHDWFARLAYEPDSWDLYLADGMEDPERTPWEALIVGLARSGVALVRSLLKVLYHLSAAASSFLSRQMELEADRFEYTLAGSAAFEGTFRQMRFLNRAASRSYEVLRTMYAQGKTLPVNFPAFVLEQQTRLDSYVRSRIETAAAGKRSGLFDSHPSDAERLRFAREAAYPGLVRLAGPATQLLSNFPALAAYYTSLHYAELLRLPHDEE